MSPAGNHLESFVYEDGRQGGFVLLKCSIHQQNIPTLKLLFFRQQLGVVMLHEANRDSATSTIYHTDPANKEEDQTNFPRITEIKQGSRPNKGTTGRERWQLHKRQGVAASDAEQ